MPATSVAILSLLSLTAAPFLSGARAERAVFSPLAWPQRNLRQPNHFLDQTQPRWRSVTGRSGDVASQRADAALVNHGGDRRCDGLVDEA
jgi:hypothetical protein